MTWAIDPSHSSVEFAVRHLGLATVRGRFKRLSGSVELDEEGRLQRIAATIDASSIDTGVEQRDAHLRSPDFLDAARYPTIEFRSTAVQPRGDGTYHLTGELTMRGQTHPVGFDVEAAAPITDPWGNQRAAAAATGKLDRTQWGLTWNQALELGGWLVGEEVRFTLDVSAVAPLAVAA
jgi:polyisoprenoid-binding protein YceI